MQVRISGKNMEVGASLSEYVNDNLIKGVSKYFEKAINGDVVFHKNGNFYFADILVNEGTGTGIIIKGNSKADDAYLAFNEALEKIEKQLRRYKRRIKNHHKQSIAEIEPAHTKLISATKYVISPIDEEQDEIASEPLIIAEKSTPIEKLSVSDAVMKMDLAGLPALLFINSKTNTINVVYHRADGNISWVEPAE